MSTIIQYDIGMISVWYRYDIGIKFHTDFIGMISVCRRFIPISYRFHTGWMYSYRFNRYEGSSLLVSGLQIGISVWRFIPISYRCHTDFIQYEHSYWFYRYVIGMKPPSYRLIGMKSPSYRYHTGWIFIPISYWINQVWMQCLVH